MSPASTGLTEAVSAILPALDQFNRFEGPDRSSIRSEWLPTLDEPLPEQGVGAEAVMELLRDVVIPRGLRVGHPGFVSWVTTAPSTTAAVGQLASAVISPQRWWLQPGNHLDTMAVRWLIELLGFPSTYVGTFTSGGSTANLVGIGGARQHAAEKLGIDAALDGIGAIPEPRIYASPETHHVVTRAMGVLGLGRRNLRTVGLDSARRADLRQMEAFIREDISAGRTPMAIVGNAGDVNTGIVDPLPEMAVLAREFDLWFHVDGAYGGWGVLDERVEAAYGDRASYDSFAVDPHKWLAAPVGTGLAICRDGELLSRAFTIEPGAYDRERNQVADAVGDAESPWGSARRRHARLGRRLLHARSRHPGMGGAQGDRRRGDARARPPPQRLRPRRGRPRPHRTRAGAAGRAAAVDRLLPLPARGLGRPGAAERAQRRHPR